MDTCMNVVVSRGIFFHIYWTKSEKIRLFVKVANGVGNIN